MEILKKAENGLEFYTINETGQSGISQSGLAILAGVSRQAIIKLEDTLVTKAPSEWLEPFVGKALTLVTNSPKIDGKAIGNLSIYSSAFCAAVLKHYASPPNSNPTAILSSFKFMEMGINAWIQGVTGWKQPGLPPSTPLALPASRPVLGASPFNHVMHIDENLDEYWLSTEVMGLFGQTKYDRFEKTILEIMTDFEMYSSEDIKKHCRKIPLRGLKKTDYKMTAHFCSALAFNIEPIPSSKCYLEAAKAYFDMREHHPAIRPLEDGEKHIVGSPDIMPMDMAEEVAYWRGESRKQRQEIKEIRKDIAAIKRRL